MAMSCAERQRLRRQRIRENPGKRASELEKDKIRWHNRKVSIHDENKRKARQIRKNWKICKRGYRARKNQLAEVTMLTPPVTPSTSGDQQPQGHRRRTTQKKVQKRIKELEVQLMEEKKKVERYRKRMYRAKISGHDMESPRHKVKQLLQRSYTSVTRRQLLFQEVLLQQFSNNYKKVKKYSTKRMFNRMFAGEIVKKYKLKKMFQDLLGCSSKSFNNVRKLKRKHNNSKASRYGEKVKQFYQENSRSTSGKKETITRHKEKKQRYVLLDSLQKLYGKFCVVHQDVRISYSLFCALRPYWVCFPRASDRATCLCKLHDNLELMVDGLKRVGAVEDTCLDTLVSSVSCDITRKACMYGTCEECAKAMFSIKKVDNNLEASYLQWKTVKDERLISGEKRQVTVTKKISVTESVGDLISSCASMLHRFKTHYFNIQTQAAFYRNLKYELAENECIVHIDFSENYESKMSKEIQSMHFGASKNQITLHTGVYYILKNGITEVTSFCSISDNCNHGPMAIWSHMSPVLDDIQKANPQIDTMHFVSDGPTTQYRQKLNFWLFMKEMRTRGIILGTWNFTESGHGKGAPDGVGAAVKRIADRLVLHGCDITNADSLYQAVDKNTEMRLYLINQIALMDEKLNLLQPIPGTLKIHQIITKKDLENKLQYRDVSCLCSDQHICSCHDLKTFTFPDICQSLNSASTQEDNNNDIKNTSSNINDDSAERKEYFSQLLDQMTRCNTYTQLKTLFSKTNIPYDISVSESEMSDSYDIDIIAASLLPHDLREALAPVKVSADGNCLPNAGSVLAFGDESHHDEIRVRIVKEQCQHERLYLDSEHLRKGLDISDRNANKLRNNFCLYSGTVQPDKLTERTITDVYRREVMDVRKNSSYMGIWQIMALSSVLGCQLFTVYPDGGNPNVRKDLNRLVTPRCISQPGRIHIMWTTTSETQAREPGFRPNHFVPLLPQKGDLDTETLNTLNDDSILDKYVVVRYDGKAYPGIVTDVDSEDVQVKCLHCIGENRFFWPIFEDLCWYRREDVLSVIPDLEKLTDRHLQVAPKLWQTIICKI